MERKYRDDLLEKDGRTFSALMNNSSIFKGSNQDWTRMKNIEKFQDSIAGLPYEDRSIFESLYDEGYFLTEIGEFELPRINEPDVYPTIQDFVDKFLNDIFPYIDGYCINKIKAAIKHANKLKEDGFSTPYQISWMTDNAMKHFVNLSKVNNLMITLANSSSYYPSSDSPFLRMDTILQAICRIGNGFTQNPQSYSKLGEEELSSIISVSLRSIAGIDVTDEAVNRAGKVDIRIYDNKSDKVRLITECKIWTGESAVLPAINQLLSYITSDNSHACLIFFVRNKDFSNVLNTAERAISSHINYVCKIDSPNNQWIEYRFKKIDDKYQYLNMNILFFHIPDIK